MGDSRQMELLGSDLSAPEKRSAPAPLPAYVPGSDTSRAAAESMRKPACSYRELVLHFILRKGSFGATSDEVQDALDLTHQNGSARVVELAQSGRIIKTERRRKTRSGRTAAVYVCPEHVKYPSSQPGRE